MINRAGENMTMDFGICMAVSIAAAYTDWRIRKIRNSLLLPTLITGLLWHVITGGLSGFLDALMGGAFPLVLFPFFVLRMLGAGDIKLLMALGAWLKYQECVTLMIFSILCGGVLALVFMLVRKNGRHRFAQLWLYLKTCMIRAQLLPYQDFNHIEEGAALPFALAIAGGLVCLGIRRSGMIPVLM